MALLEVNGIGKSFGTTKVLRDISFELAEGEALAIIGSSGSGKTTLRCLNFWRQRTQAALRWRARHCGAPPIPAPRARRPSAKSGCISGWCSRISTCSRSTALQNVMLAGQLAKERPDYKQNKSRSWPISDARRGSCWRRWGFLDREGHYRTSFRAGSSSGWQSPAPWRCTGYFVF